MHRVGIAIERVDGASPAREHVVTALAMAKQLMRIAVGNAADIVIERDVLVTGVRVTAQAAGRITIDCHRTFPRSKRSAFALFVGADLALRFEDCHRS